LGLPAVHLPELQSELAIHAWPFFGPAFVHDLRSQSEPMLQEVFEVLPAVQELKAHTALLLVVFVPHTKPALPPPAHFLVQVPLPLQGVLLSHAVPALLPPTHTPLSPVVAGHVPSLWLHIPTVEVEQIPPLKVPHVPFATTAPQVPGVDE
jgi:hypothetical protein